MRRSKAFVPIAALLALMTCGSVSCQEQPSAPSGSGASGDLGHQAKALYARRLGDRATRAEVARELGRNKVVEAVEPLRAAAKDPDPNIRAACLWALGEIGDASAAVPLNFYVTDPEPSVRFAAAEALGKLRCPEAVRGLCEAMNDAAPQIRLSAVNGLAACRDDKATREVVRAMADADPAVRDAATEHVIRIGGPAFRHLGEAARSAEPETLLRIVPALTRTDAREAVPVLVSLLVSSDPRIRLGAPRNLIPVRDAAIEALVALGEPAIEPLCRRTVDEPVHATLKGMAGEVLGRIGSPVAVAPITDHVLGWKKIPSERELSLWVNVLREIGGNEANQALARIHQHAERLRRGPPDVEVAALELDEVRLTEVEAGGSEPNPENGIYALVLVKALEGGKPLTVHLDRKDGRFRRAFATARTFNQVSHDVDASGLRLEGATLKGRIKVTINPDPYVPADHRPVSCAYTVEAAVSGADVTGRFEGTYGAQEVRGGVWGLLQARPPKPEPAWFHLRLVDALDGMEGMNYHHRAHASFTIKDGKTYDGRITEQDQTVPLHHYIGWSGQVRSADMKFPGDTLTGTLDTLIRSSRGPLISWGGHTFTLDGQVVGKIAAGRFKTHIEGTYIKTRGFVGTVKTAAEPEMDLEDCRFVLVLDKALEGRKSLKILLDRQGGTFRDAFTVVRTARCDVDASGLTVRNRMLRGTVRLAIRSPEDGKRVSCVYTLEADASHSYLSGTFTGTCGEREVSGAVSGESRGRAQ